MRLSASKRKQNKVPLPPLSASGLKTYLRLLDYARPHWAMFLLGVVGMVLFAAVDIGFAWLVKKFLDGAFVERDPRMLVYVPAGIIVLFLVRGRRRLPVRLRAGLGRAARSSRRSGTTYSRATCSFRSRTSTGTASRNSSRD